MKINFHKFNVGDVDDPEIIAGFGIHDWQQTEQGQWVMENAYNLTYHTQTDANFWGHDVIVRGEITDPRKLTEYFLRWPKHDES